MRRQSSSIATALLTLLLLPAGTARASETITPRLVEILFGGEIVPGAAPASVKEAIPLFDGITVLGAHLRDGGFSLAIEVTGSPLDLFARYATFFTNAGWRVQRNRAWQPQPEVALCGPELESLKLFRVGDDRSLFGRVDYLAQDGFCSLQRVVRFQSNMPAVLALDRIEWPPGCTLTMGGAGGGGDSSHTGASGHCQLGTARLAAHLDDHFERQGWQPRSREEDDRYVLTTWWASGEEGKRWHALVLVSAEAPSDGTSERVQSVALHMMKVPAASRAD